MNIKLVLVGAGWAGKFHVEAVHRHPYARLIAIIDEDERKSREITTRMGDIPVFSSIKLFLESGILFDGALVCTLPDSHIAISRTFISLGKHVLCEKPMGRSSREIQSLIELASQNNSIVGVNYNQRFAQAIQKLGTHLNANEQVHIIHAAMHQKGPVNNSEHTHEYFLVTDACCHLIDTLLYLNGGIKQVHAFGSKLDSEIYSNITVNLLFQNGSVGSMTHTFVGGLLDSQHPFQRYDVSTDRARYTVDNMVDTLTIYPHQEQHSSQWSPSVFEQRNYESTMLNSVSAWIDSILNNEPAPIGLAQSFQVARVVEACISSLQSGCSVHLDQ